MIRKKLCYFIMLCFLCVFISSVNVFATEILEYTIDGDYSSETYTYIIKSDNTVEIIGYEGNAVSVNIPEKINEMDVTSIADCAMSYNTSAYSLNIPKTVSYIGKSFATDFENLESIIVDDDNQYYSTKAGTLYDKKKTTLIRVPMNKKTIVIDDNVENILEDAFYSCSSLDSVNIPAKVNNIEGGAFSFCNNLTNITVDEDNISFISVDGSLYDINITTLKRFSAECDLFKVPSTVKEIEEYACSGIEDLAIDSNTIIIPYHVSYIGEYAFWGCDNVETLAILNKECEIIDDSEDDEGGAHLSYASNILGYIGSTAHEYAEMFNLGFGEYECEHVYECIETEATCDSDGNIKNVCSLCGNEENIKIDKLGHIGGSATCCKKAICTRCDTEYGELSPNDHVNTEIRNKKDASCTENGYTGDIYCVDCETKTATGTKIEKKAHTWDTGVVTKEATSTEKGEKTYTCTVCRTTNTEELPALGALEVGTTYKSDDGKATYIVTTSDLANGTVTYVAPTNKKASTVTIPVTVVMDGVTYKVTAIEKNAFKNNKRIKKVNIGKNVTTIGANAFYNCTKLKTLNLGNNVTNIGDKAFYKCSALTKITIPSKVIKIGKNAFEGCKKLKNITITTGKLKAIGKNAFKGINKKASFKLKGTKKAKTTLKKKLKSKKIGYVKTWKIK